MVDQPAVRPRPEIGVEIVTEERIQVCILCGYAVEHNLCSFGCRYDGDHKQGTALTAVYRTTSILLREEDYNGNILRGGQ
jgi:hypothetical protein